MGVKVPQPIPEGAKRPSPPPAPPRPSQYRPAVIAAKGRVKMGIGKILVGDLLGIALIAVLFWVSGMAARIGEGLSRHRFSGYWMLFCPILLVALVVLTFSQLVRNGITLRLLAGALAGLGSSFIALFVSASYDVGAMVLFRQLGFLGVLLVYGSVSFWSAASLANLPTLSGHKIV